MKTFRNPRKYQGGWITAAIAGGASLLGGMMSNKANAKQAEIDREWQRENAQNAHQYQVADMRAAGLNPILSATGGSGARASGGSTLGTQSDVISPAVSSAREASRVSQELDNMKANEKLTKSQDSLTAQQEKTSKEQQHNYFQDTDMKAHQSGLLQAQTATEMARNLTELEKAKTEVTLQGYHQANASSAKAQAGKTSQETRSSKVTADLDEKMREIERIIQAGEGASSAVRNILPGLRKSTNPSLKRPR